MHKKLLIIMILMVTAPCGYAMNVEELNIDFFSKFNDDCLAFYVNSALENNHDLKKAEKVVEQYRQQAKISLGKELPSLSVSANYLGVHVPRLDNFKLTQNAFVLPFFANYEPDFLLKNRDKTRSANKAYEASKQNEKAVFIALLTDVATVYTNILQYDELIDTAAENLEIYTKIYESDNRKLSRGTIDSTIFNNSKNRVETAKINLEILEKQRDILLMQLAVLSGISPNEYEKLQRGTLKDFEYCGKIPTEISSDVIFNRPDVLMAEKNLEKAKIDVRVARKEFLPRFNITGIWAFNTIASGTFFSWKSSLAALLAGATQDIFAGGRKVANLKYKKAKYEELFEEYRQTDLIAVKEVNTVLCLIKKDQNSENNTKTKLQNSLSNLENSKKKLNRGTVSQPEYLVSLSEFLKTQNELTQAKTQRITDYYTLYKAVGGQL